MLQWYWVDLKSGVCFFFFFNHYHPNRELTVRTDSENWQILQISGNRDKSEALEMKVRFLLARQGQFYCSYCYSLLLQMKSSLLM